MAISAINTAGRRKKPSSLVLCKKFVQARAAHPTSKMPWSSAAGSVPVITHADSKITITAEAHDTNYTCGFVWVGVNGGEGVGGCSKALGSQTCNSIRLLQMDVFQKWIYPCIMDARHASWTPVWHTCWCIICTLDAKWASNGNDFDRQTSNLRWDHRDVFISNVAFQPYTYH